MTRVEPGDVAYLGPRHPAKADDCAIAFFLAEAPPYPTTTIASGKTSCVERQDCMDRLRRLACHAGADVIYGFTEGTQAGLTSTTTLSRRRGCVVVPATRTATPLVGVGGSAAPSGDERG